MYIEDVVPPRLQIGKIYRGDLSTYKAERAGMIWSPEWDGTILIKEHRGSTWFGKVIEGFSMYGGSGKMISFTEDSYFHKALTLNDALDEPISIEVPFDSLFGGEL